MTTWGIRKGPIWIAMTLWDPPVTGTRVWTPFLDGNVVPLGPQMEAQKLQKLPYKYG